MSCALSVIIPTHNPHEGRLRRTLDGLRAQSLPVGSWETIVVNNASRQFPAEAFFAAGPANLTIEAEPVLGLTSARRCGFRAARGDLAVLVDDDNVLAPDYLEQVLAIFARCPRVGLAGGRSRPEFEREPVDWEREFLPLLALRDLGPAEIIASGLRPAGADRNTYPDFAPIGAGMALRRAAWEAWLAALESGPAFTDRRGGELTSSGDNDIVLCAMEAGWEAGYFPELSLTHLIPAGRLDPTYLARLNRGIQKSWLQVLRRHDACPWPPLTPFGARVRQVRAWFTHRAWSSPAARIRWQGACGHFEGRVPSP
jgi:glycosyltransferase involved in cell wall biosynthesis